MQLLAGAGLLLLRLRSMTNYIIVRKCFYFFLGVDQSCTLVLRRLVFAFDHCQSAGQVVGEQCAPTGHQQAKSNGSQGAKQPVPVVGRNGPANVDGQKRAALRAISSVFPARH